jgi:hypothetical protein
MDKIFRLLAIGAALLGFWSGVAEARTRDEVMSNAFRCSAIGEGHQWLDCYYGAAQPLRSQLALPPASQAQIDLAQAPPAGQQPSADQVRARDIVMSQASGCAGIEDDRRWLDCYYGAAQPVRALLGLAPAPQARSYPQLGTDTAAVSSVSGADEFGLSASARRGPARPVPDRIVSRLADIKFDRYGVFTMTLANGQVWRQIEGDTAHASLKPPVNRYTVQIKHGFFGSYNLTIAGVPGLFRVLRVD